MKRNNIYICPNGGFRIPHNKHLGKKPKDWQVPKYSKGKQL